MSVNKIQYTKNYRRNLELYWRQYYPIWAIPKGYHVHHIKPKCTFKDKDDLRIHHPRNLIALHPDDHVTIHVLRGDKQLSAPFLTSVVNRIVSNESCKKMSIAQKKRFINRPVSNETISKMIASRQNVSDITREKMSISAKKRKATAETKQKISIIQTGTGNSRFKGYYITPWGKFASLDAAALDTVSRFSINSWCKNNTRIIRKQAIWQCAYLSDNDCGKTFDELGFAFEHINTNKVKENN